MNTIAISYMDEYLKGLLKFHRITGLGSMAASFTKQVKNDKICRWIGLLSPFSYKGGNNNVKN
jgi:hypothetical protein